MSVLELQARRKPITDKLSRARRLYARLVRSHIIENPQDIKVVAERARSAGLYSEKTIIKDVGFSLFRHAHRIDDCDMDWWKFCDHFNLWKAWYK